ncbi:extracellular solute-binding protein [Paeniroseomonas aquatica]|uniref:extracellular solute-binding protein n=1 Tax=Paeniroseomonas aquatica TaxID=373043 RepID=UPI00360A207D
MDVVCLGDADTHAMGQLGLLEELTPEKVPNLAKVIPALRLPFTLPHIYSVRTILTNPARIQLAPARYADLFEERFRNRIGFSDLLFTHMTEAAAIAAGGDERNHQPGYAKLLEWKRLGARVYPSNEALAAALKSEEVSATIMWLGRAYMWKKAGIPVQAVIPAEGPRPISPAPACRGMRATRRRPSPISMRCSTPAPRWASPSGWASCRPPTRRCPPPCRPRSA